MCIFTFSWWYQDYILLVCDIVQFRRNILPPSCLLKIQTAGSSKTLVQYLQNRQTSMAKRCIPKYGIPSNLRRTFFSHLAEPKIRVHCKFVVSFFTLRKPRKHHFPRRTSGLAKRVVNFTDSEMYLLAKIFFSWKSLFTNGMRLILEGGIYLK
jgi:hypothetical protein